MSSDVQNTVLVLQQSLDTLHAKGAIAPIEPMRAEEFLLADANSPTEKVLTDDEIVKQVEEEEKQVEQGVLSELSLLQDE